MLLTNTAATKESFLCSGNLANIQNCHGLSRNISSSILRLILTAVAGSFFELGDALLNLRRTVGDQRRNISEPFPFLSLLIRLVHLLEKTV
jgi:hypothetical protein